jgi:predicted PurR-regulated permease PerM
MGEIKNQWPKFAGWFALIAGLIIVYKLLDNFSAVATFFGNLMSILAPFFAGILIAYLLYIPSKSVEKFYKKSKIRVIKAKARPLSIFTVYLIAVIIILIAIKVIWPIVFASVMELAGNIQGYYSTLISRFYSLPEDSIFKSDFVKDFLTSLQSLDLTQYINVQDISQYAKGIINVLSSVFNIFVALVVSVYLLAGRTQIIGFLRRAASAIFKKKTFENLGKYFNSTNQIFFKFLSSQFLDAIVVGVLSTIALSIMGVKYAPLLGTMIGLFNMIPYFGAIIAVGLSAIITAITGGIYQAIWMLIIVVILQQIDANIINPKILGNSLKISPLIVIFAVTVGGAYFGVLGMFLAVPIAAVFKIVVNDYIDYKNELNKQE